MATPLLDNRQLGPDVPRANLLVNGGFEIWQRTTGTVNTLQGMAADLWRIAFIASGDSVVMQQETSVVDSGSACLKIGYSKSTGGSTIQQKLEPGLVKQLRGKTISLSMRMRNENANGIQAAIFNDVTGWTIAPFLSQTLTWLTSTVTLAVPANAASIEIGIHLQNNCTAYIDNAMLVVGSTPADYVPLHPADDLARCLRYYEKIGDGWGSITINQYQVSGGNVQFYIPFKTWKPVNPTITKNGTWTVANCGQPAVAGNSGAQDGVSILLTAAATGTVGLVNNASNANFTIEAN